MKLKDLVPPIVVNLARRFKQNQKLYKSYEDALAVCESGYEEDDLVNVVYEKTKLYRDLLHKQSPFVSDIASFRTLVGLSLAIRENELNVIDFGGACGAHYFLAKILFGDRIKLRWHVVETTKMVSKAIELEDEQLKFFDNLQKAKNAIGQVDLIFSSSTLPYVSKPYEYLERLIECRADNIFITRVGLSTLQKELVTIHKSKLSANGPGPMPHGMRDKMVKYPVTYMRKDKFEKILNKVYAIKFMFNEGKDKYQAAGFSIDMYGYFGSIKNSI